MFTNAEFFKQLGFVELVFFLYKTSESLVEPVVKLYTYEHICQQTFQNNQTLCENLKGHPNEEMRVQELSAYYIMIYRILLNVPSIIWGLLCGAWSDRVGRKLPMVLSCFGAMISAMMYMVSTLYVSSAIALIFVGAALNGLFGRSSVISMAVHSYATDVSQDSKRTNKLSQLLAMNFYGLFVGSLMAGMLLHILSYVSIFLIVVVLNALNILNIMFLLKESVHLPGDSMQDGIHDQSGHMWSLCRVGNVADSIGVVCKRRSDDRHWLIFLFFIILMLNQMCKAGEVDVTLLYVRKAPLSWPDYMYGYFLASDYAFLGLALCTVLPVLSDVMKVNDQKLVIIGIIFKVSRLIIVTFSTKTWMLFGSVVVGSMTAVLVSGSKSFLSKNVDDNEVGKLFSLISCGETLANLLGSISFTTLYSNTVKYFAGTSFLVEACLYIVTLILVLFMTKKIRNLELKPLLEEESSNK